MALFVIPGDNGYISTNSGQNALKISGAVKNIVEHGTLKLKNNKFNGFEVRGIVFFTGHNPNLQKMAFLLFRGSMAISQRIVVKMYLLNFQELSAILLCKKYYNFRVIR